MEPLIDKVNLQGYTDKIDWIIAGAESGDNLRPMDEDWVRSLRDQCNDSDIPFFYKQRIDGMQKIETPELDGKIWTEFPK